jgi:hypothetical protein
VDGLVGDPALLKAIQQDSTYSKHILPYLETLLAFPLDSLVICETGDQSGKGVFLSLDAKPIPTGTVVGVYAGHLYDACLDRRGDDSRYRVSAREEEHQLSIVKQLLLSPSIDGRAYGNITRYFQDLPEPPTLLQTSIVTKTGTASTELEKKARNNIATANLFIWPGVYRGVPISFLATMTDIQPGDQLGWSYGGNFDFEKKLVFNNAGKIIGYYKDNNTILIEDIQSLKENNKKPELDPTKIKQTIETFTNYVIKEKDIKTSGNASVLSMLFQPANKQVSREMQFEIAELKSRLNL